MFTYPKPVGGGGGQIKKKKNEDACGGDKFLCVHHTSRSYPLSDLQRSKLMIDVTQIYTARRVQSHNPENGSAIGEQRLQSYF